MRFWHVLLLLVVATIVVVVAVVAVMVVVVVVTCPGLSWTGKYKLGSIARIRVDKYNLGTRAGKCKVSVRVVKHKLLRACRYKLGARPRPTNTNWGPGLANTIWGPGPVNTNWRPGPGAGIRI